MSRRDSQDTVWTQVQTTHPIHGYRDASALEHSVWLPDSSVGGVASERRTSNVDLWLANCARPAVDG